ncbi:bifunctional DNA primase/polymerase [Streptomyces capparidis]
MGITFGDFRTGVRRRARSTVSAAAAEYAGRWGWVVAPGARLLRGDRCGCGDPGCAAPGAHPLPGAEVLGPGAGAEEARAAWERHPGAPVLLLTGYAFDAVEVAEPAGRRAMLRLERMGTRLGPVLVTPHGRAQFFVAPGAAAELPALLYKMGWDDAGLDLRPLGLGDHVVAPPSELGALGPVRWLRPPTPESAVHPPEARLVLGTLAYASHRERRPAGSGPWLVPS